MRGHIRVTMVGMDAFKKKIKKGKGINTVFDRRGSFAILLVKTGHNIKNRRIVSVDNIPGSYRHEFEEMYPPEHPAPAAPVSPTYVVQTNPPPAPVPDHPRMMFCSLCGAELQDGAGFCSKCGSPQQK